MATMHYRKSLRAASQVAAATLRLVNINDIAEARRVAVLTRRKRRPNRNAAPTRKTVPTVSSETAFTAPTTALAMTASPIITTPVTTLPPTAALRKASPVTASPVITSSTTVIPTTSSRVAARPRETAVESQNGTELRVAKSTHAVAAPPETKPTVSSETTMTIIANPINLSVKCLNGMEPKKMTQITVAMIDPAATIEKVNYDDTHIVKTVVLNHQSLRLECEWNASIEYMFAFDPDLKVWWILNGFGTYMTLTRLEDESYETKSMIARFGGHYDPSDDIEFAFKEPLVTSTTTALVPYNVNQNRKRTKRLVDDAERLMSTKVNYMPDLETDVDTMGTGESERYGEIPLCPSKTMFDSRDEDAYSTDSEASTKFIDEGDIKAETAASLSQSKAPSESSCGDDEDMNDESSQVETASSLSQSEAPSEFISDDDEDMSDYSSRVETTSSLSQSEAKSGFICGDDEDMLDESSRTDSEAPSDFCFESDCVDDDEPEDFMATLESLGPMDDIQTPPCGWVHSE